MSTSTSTSTASINNIKNLTYNILKTFKDGIIKDQANPLGTVSNLPFTDPKEASQSTGISPLMGETFVLSSPPIRMKGIEDTATQQVKSNLRCAKYSEDLSSCLPPIGFLRFSFQLQGSSKPLIYLTCKHIIHYNCIDNLQKLCSICPPTDMEIDDGAIVTVTQDETSDLVNLFGSNLGFDSSRNPPDDSIEIVNNKR
ncbi:14654_t:CDS:2 [Dentiscutata erythropus]|uniref:14654_t:CDS:1 n=1 Tax=Dentiscutata erythropus TaxID=1348616 RepID=A0A9N9ATJ5_9GLOM|nr:14654_t:CDS:2 [Dentiscutata erythropus]